METIYEWLYAHYACPQMADINAEQDELLEQFIINLQLPPENRVHILDFLLMLRMQWGVKAFSAGMQLGKELAAPYSDTKFHDTLVYLLAKLDQPVA